jgi:hypothetical protein
MKFSASILAVAIAAPLSVSGTLDVVIIVRECVAGHGCMEGFFVRRADSMAMDVLRRCYEWLSLL